jgi:hypothetical protein
MQPVASSPTLSNRSLSNTVLDIDNGTSGGTASGSRRTHSTTGTLSSLSYAALHSVHTAQSASSSLQIVPPVSLTIDTNPLSRRGLPSPEPSPDFYESKDPMGLASKRMSEEQIEAIQSSKEVKNFYREQNELITDLLDPPEGREGHAEQEERNQTKASLVKENKSHSRSAVVSCGNAISISRSRPLNSC